MDKAGASNDAAPAGRLGGMRDRYKREEEIQEKEFPTAERESLEKELNSLKRKIEELDPEAPGTPKHLLLMHRYLDKLDEKNHKLTIVGFKMIFDTIKLCQENQEINNSYIK